MHYECVGIQLHRDDNTTYTNVLQYNNNTNYSFNTVTIIEYAVLGNKHTE